MKAARTKDAPDPRWEAETVWVAALAAFASVIAFLIYVRNGDLLLYGDAVAHINIARRVFDSRTPGLLQLGTVWLPLLHLLMIPFVISKSAWQTGVGGSFPSMAAYVFSVAGIFRLVRGVLAASGRTQSTASATAWFAAAIYGLNPNLLYLQSTAMTEALYLACFVWTLVYFSEFLRAASGPEWTVSAKRTLWKCAGCLASACLTRYDGWFLAACIAGAVVVVGWRSGIQGTWRAVSAFVLLAAAVPILWLCYNGIVYRNALEFANGPYSARAIEHRSLVAGSPSHPGTHNLPVAALYFLKACEFSVAEGSLQRLWLFLAAVGFVPMFMDRRLASLLFLWTPLPFYMISVAYGGVPIFTPAWWPHSLYNLRYGVQLLPALAIFLALAVEFMVSVTASRYGKWVFALLGVAVVIISYTTVWKAQPACYREALVNSRTRLQLERALAEQLKGLPPQASILMYLGAHVGALQDAGISLDRTINEGNHRVWKQPSDPEGLWERSLADPAGHADFAIAFEGDPVWQAVHERDMAALVIIAVNGQQKAGIYRTR
jgi:hypothetical protein